MKPPQKCPFCNKKLSIRQASSSSKNLFYTCYRDSLRTEDVVVHFECVAKNDVISEIYMEVGNYYVSIVYDSRPNDCNFFLYEIKTDESNPLKESLVLVTKMSGFFPEIDFENMGSLLEKVQVWQTFS